MLTEIFRQKLIVSDVILAFLDHLKPKIFFVGQPWWPTLSATSFQNLWIPLEFSFFKLKFHPYVRDSFFNPRCDSIISCCKGILG